MSETKFRKGEWYVLREGIGDLFVEPGIYYTDILELSDEEREEAIANANLIAVSPNMYRELETDAKFLRSTAKWLAEHMGLKNTAIVESMFYRADKIDELLAKARNEK